MENFNNARRQREFRSATKFIDKETDYNRFTTIPTDEELLATDCGHSGAAEHDLVEVWCEGFNPLDPRLRVSISKWDFFLFLFSTWWKDYDILRVPEGPLYYALLNDLKFHAKNDKMRTFTASRYDIGPQRNRSDENVFGLHKKQSDVNNNNVIPPQNKKPRKIKINKQAVKINLTHYYLADPDNFSDSSQQEAEHEGEFEEDYFGDGNTSGGSVLSLQMSLASEPIRRPLCHLSPPNLFKRHSFDSLLFDKNREKQRGMLPSCNIFSKVHHKNISGTNSLYLESQSQLNSLQYEKKFSSSYGFTQVRSRRSTINPVDGMEHANPGYGSYQHYHMPSIIHVKNSITPRSSPLGGKKKKPPKKLTLEEECESVRSTPPELDLDQSFYNDSIAAYFGYIRKGNGDLTHLCPISSFYTLPPEEEEEEEAEEETAEAIKKRYEKEKRRKLDEFLQQLKPEVVSDWEDDEPELEITKCTENEKKTLRQHFRKRSSLKKTQDAQDECDFRCTSPSLKNYIKSRQDKWEKQMAAHKEVSAASKIHPYKVTAEQYGLYSEGVCGEEVPIKFKYIKNKPKRVKKGHKKHFKKHERRSTLRSESLKGFIEESSSDEEEHPINYKTPGEEWIENNLKPDSKTSMTLAAVKSSQYKEIMNLINTDTKHEIAMPTRTWAAYHLYGLDRLKDTGDLKVKTQSKMIKSASQIAQDIAKVEEDPLAGHENIEDKNERRTSILEEVEEEECSRYDKKKKKMKEGRDHLTLRAKKMDDGSTISSLSSGEEAVEEEEVPQILIEIEKNIHGIPLSAFYSHHRDRESEHFLRMLLRRAKKGKGGSDTDSNDEKDKDQDGEGGGGKQKGRSIYKRKYKTGVNVLGRGSKGSRYIARKARLKRLSVVQPTPEIKLKRLDSLEMHKEIANYVLCKHFNENNGGITISRRLQEDKKIKGVLKTAIPYCHDPTHFDSIFCIPGGDFKTQMLEAAQEFVIRREVVVTGTISDMPIVSLAFVRKLKCVYGYPAKHGNKHNVFELPELIETMKITC